MFFVNRDGCPHYHNLKHASNNENGPQYYLLTLYRVVLG